MKAYSLLLCLVIATLLLAGCGGEATPTTAGQPTSTPPPQAAPTQTAVASPTTQTLPTPTTSEAQATPTTAQSTPTSAAQSTPSAATGGTPAKVTFALDWTPNTNHTGIYVALQKGWYKDEGLDVQILPYSDANTPDTLVANGQADFGVSFTEAMVQDRAANLPVKSVAAILQTNTSALASLKSSGLDTLAKFEGKRYSGFGSPFEVPVITTMLKNAGAPTGKFDNITTNLSGYDAVVAKQADFVWIYMGWEGIQAKLDGVALNTFMLKDNGIPDYYTPVIIANEAFLQNHGDVAKRFLDATARGYEYGVTNPDDAANILISAVPAGTFANPELPIKSQEYLAPYYKMGQPRWGLQSLKMWTDYPRFMASTGLLTSGGSVVKPEDIDSGSASLFTNDYLPQH
jgi:ABC-type nitrate/sulfonate/bicarbonate transport system substrate-binding protein